MFTQVLLFVAFMHGYSFMQRENERMICISWQLYISIGFCLFLRLPPTCLGHFPVPHYFIPSTLSPCFSQDGAKAFLPLLVEISQISPRYLICISLAGQSELKPCGPRVNTSLTCDHSLSYWFKNW